LEKSFASARRLLSAALLERWPQICRVRLTFTVAENRDFDGKETLIVKRAIAISKRVLG